MSLVALGGMFRQAEGYLDRWFGQVCALDDALTARGDRLRLVIAEGDSTDRTREKLYERTRFLGLDTVLVIRAHGGTHAWHSVDIPERWKALSWVCNGILDGIAPDIDKFVYVETDLEWQPAALLGLLDQLSPAYPAIAPMCWAGEHFYDVWGHVKDGVQFGPFPPYHHALGPGLTRVDSAGSCVAMLGDVARRVRYGPDDLVRGLGRSIRQQGYSLWVDPTLSVRHL